MKARLLLPILTVAAGITAHAQSPGVPPPPSPPQGPGNAQRQGPGQQDNRREHGRRMPGPASQQQGNPQERAEHIAEAMKHLKAAGLGHMAERIEEMLKKTHDGPGRGHSLSGRLQARPQQPQQPSGPAPRQFSRPGPFPPGAPGPRPSTGSNDDLRAQVQQLTRQVEELRNSVGNRSAEHRDGQRGGEHHEARPGPRGDQPQARPQDRAEHKERRPQGDQPQAKPQGGGEGKERRPEGDGPRRENRDAPPQPKRDGAEQIKPALLPQSDSIE